MTKSVAKHIVEEREKNGRVYSSKTDVTQIKGCGAKTFEQIAGFLRVNESLDVLDKTGIHCESYPLARILLKKCAKDKTLLQKLISSSSASLEHMAKELKCDEVTLRDIACMLSTAEENNDERITTTTNSNNNIGLAIRSGARTLKTLEKDQILKGVVKNVCQFGVFIDCGVETSGLVHKSTFKGEPHQIASAGQSRTVKVGKIDLDKNRLELFFV